MKLGVSETSKFCIFTQLYNCTVFITKCTINFGSIAYFVIFTKLIRIIKISLFIFPQAQPHPHLSDQTEQHKIMFFPRANASKFSISLRQAIPGTERTQVFKNSSSCTEDLLGYKIGDSCLSSITWNLYGSVLQVIYASETSCSYRKSGL